MVNAAHRDRLGRLINFTTVGNGTPGLFQLKPCDRRPANTPMYRIAGDHRGLRENTKVPGDRGSITIFIDPETAHDLDR